MPLLICSIIITRTVEGQINGCQTIALSEFVKKSYFIKTMSLLTQEDKFDTLDAIMHKSLSSNGFVSFEQTPDSVIKEMGKIEENNIVLVLLFKEDRNEKTFILTQHLGYCHAFIYDIDQNLLNRIPNKGPTAITRLDFLRFNRFDDSSIYFISELIYDRQNVVWRKHFKYDSVEFYHFMNCRVTNNEEECKKIDTDFSFLKRLFK